MLGSGHLQDWAGKHRRGHAPFLDGPGDRVAGIPPVLLFPLSLIVVYGGDSRLHIEEIYPK